MTTTIYVYELMNETVTQLVNEWADAKWDYPSIKYVDPSSSHLFQN